MAIYQSDAQGWRKSKTVGSTTTNYITDGDNRVVQEYDSTSGAVQPRYAYGAGKSIVLNRLDVASGTRANQRGQKKLIRYLPPITTAP
ncbi:MAG: hypothetical protein QF512_15370 [Alphaproteobacteria bacterium]|nr:hypothetical protein [Alphaproteobacteria bacterium]